MSQAEPVLSADVQLQRGHRQLACRLAFRAQETLAVVGPNGAGKTSLLLALAGLLPLDAGRIESRQRGLLDDGHPDRFVPPEARRMGVVFQDDRLFPHLTLRANVAYGLPQRTRTERQQAEETARAWLDRVELGVRADALPAQLSGGERQRVALARALAPRPELLLLDEPLAAVDVAQRPALRSLLRRELAEFRGACVVVTHDAVDAFTLAQQIAVLEDGRITQVGTVAHICQHPKSRFIADLIGVNLLPAILEEGTLRLPGTQQLVVADTTELANGPVLLTIHPRAIALFPERPSGSPRNVWQAAVVAMEATGDRLRVRFGGPLPLVAEVTPAAMQELGVEVGRALWLAVKATEIAAYPA